MTIGLVPASPSGRGWRDERQPVDVARGTPVTARDETPVLVGFDGSTPSVRALRWAAEHAGRTGHALRVVVARGELHTISRRTDRWSRVLAGEVVEEARHVLERARNVEARIAVVDGPPAQAILEQSPHVAAVVLGSHGHGRVAAAVLGSVSQQVAQRSEAPTIVVRPVTDTASTVVYAGVDGSEPGYAALDFAVGLAGTYGWSVRAVYCWERLPLQMDDRFDGVLQEVTDELERREAAVAARVREVGLRGAGVPVTFQASRREPVQVLVHASERAAMLVVGCRGRGAFLGSLLGSVSTTVLHRAACPVVVVRGPVGA
jgi:nucleotide-binding universal stress UspA family protein